MEINRIGGNQSLQQQMVRKVDKIESDEVAVENVESAPPPEDSVEVSSAQPAANTEVEPAVEETTSEPSQPSNSIDVIA